MFKCISRIAFPHATGCAPYTAALVPPCPAALTPSPSGRVRILLKNVISRVSNYTLSSPQKCRPRANMRFSKTRWYSKARDRRTKPVVDFVEGSDLGWRGQVFPLTCDRGRGNDTGV